MKLAFAAEMRLEEADIFLPDWAIDEGLIVEEGEGPRWKFRYDNWHHDPTPDVLLLGAWRHPNTGNDLVGGVNIHYLDKHQINNLAHALPQIMGAGNLKARYWKGRQLVPDVFQNYYRTYNSDYIRGVQRDVMYPKYGFLQTAKNWLKKTLGSVFKSKAQRQQDAQPKYPDDLADMQAQLDTVVANLQRQDTAKQAAAGEQPTPTKQEPTDTPEMRAARDVFLQFQREKAMRELGLGVDDQEFSKSYDDYIDQATQSTKPQPQTPAKPQQRQPQQRVQQPQRTRPRRQQTPQQQTPQLPPDPQDAQKRLDQERAENAAELQDPNNDIDLGESITYYSPVTGHMIVETISVPRSQSLVDKLLGLRPALAAAAQTVYDNWEQDADGLDSMYGGGGICDGVASAMAEVLAHHDIQYTDGGHDGDDHAYLIAYDAVDSFIVDITPAIYENGIGMCWVKVPGVQFEPDDVSIVKTYRPDWLDDENYA